MVAVLPCEIHELIIDELRYCFPELKNCSLVCRSWLPRCRFHLFRVIPIQIGPRMSPILSYTRERCSTSPFFYTYNQCPQCRICNASPLPVISCVRGLRIHPEHGPPSTRVTRPCSIMPHAAIPSTSWSVITPHSSFKHIRFLHIHWRAINWFHNPVHIGGPTAFEKILQRIDSLEHLIIESRWRFSVKEDILRSLATCAPNLRTLSLLQFQWFPLFTPPVIENILDMWSVRFKELHVPPLRPERLCIWNPVQCDKNSAAVADLIKVAILPSPCLDLSNLRYLAMSASSLRGALDDGRFPNLGKKVTHLAIMDLDTGLVYTSELVLLYLIKFYSSIPAA